jgi:hypothetical protein
MGLAIFFDKESRLNIFENGWEKQSNQEAFLWLTSSALAIKIGHVLRSATKEHESNR